MPINFSCLASSWAWYLVMASAHFLASSTQRLILLSLSSYSALELITSLLSHKHLKLLVCINTKYTLTQCLFQNQSSLIWEKKVLSLFCKVPFVSVLQPICILHRSRIQMSDGTQFYIICTSSLKWALDTLKCKLSNEFVILVINSVLFLIIIYNYSETTAGPASITAR